MRKILFRGKQADNGEWVLSVNLIQKYRNGMIKVYFPDGIETSYYVEVIPETVGQYTGLTDKNGTKIFEGDILHTPNNSNCTLWYVDYKNTAFCCNQGNANYSCVLDEFMQYSYVRIIGNIHDNPELLEAWK